MDETMRMRLRDLLTIDSVSELGTSVQKVAGVAAACRKRLASSKARGETGKLNDTPGNNKDVK